MKGISSETVDNDANGALMRVLETRLVQYEEDGGEYARQILELLRQVDDATIEPRVLKGVIEVVLTDIRTPCEFFWLCVSLPLHA
jgi:hypothetical protein